MFYLLIFFIFYSGKKLLNKKKMISCLSYVIDNSIHLVCRLIICRRYPWKCRSLKPDYRISFQLLIVWTPHIQVFSWYVVRIIFLLCIFISHHKYIFLFFFVYSWMDRFSGHTASELQRPTTNFATYHAQLQGFNRNTRFF